MPDSPNTSGIKGENYWLAFDIGCIECCQESRVIGVFLTEDGAKKACKEALEEMEKHWVGQHNFGVFPITIPNS